MHANAIAQGKSGYQKLLPGEQPSSSIIVSEIFAVLSARAPDHIPLSSVLRGHWSPFSIEALLALNHMRETESASWAQAPEFVLDTGDGISPVASA